MDIRGRTQQKRSAGRRNREEVTINGEKGLPARQGEILVNQRRIKMERNWSLDPQPLEVPWQPSHFSLFNSSSNRKATVGLHRNSKQAVIFLCDNMNVLTIQFSFPLMAIYKLIFKAASSFARENVMRHYT